MIAWQYLDKRSATIKALKDFRDMQFIVENHEKEIAEIRSEMSTTGRAVLSDMPKCQLNPHARETRIVTAIDEINILEERYNKAVEFTKWFEPAWGRLTDVEQFVLTEFYSDNQRSGANARLQYKLNYSESHVERLRQKALSRLTLMLYGGIL